MLALPLFVITLALAPTGDGSRLELGAVADFEGTAVRVSPLVIGFGGDGGALGGQAGASFTLFGRRVVDDDAPPSLQPYLQRVFTLHVDGGGGGFRFAPDVNNANGGNDSTNGYADAYAAGYARWLYGYVGFGMRYRSDSPSHYSLLQLPLDVAAGVRFGDVRLSLGWSVSPTRVNEQSFGVPFWGGVYAHAFAVVRRRLALDAQVTVVDGGAAADAGATVYLARRFGVGVFARGGAGAPSELTYRYQSAGGGVSFEAWTNARTVVAITYSFDWTAYGYTQAPTENDYRSIIALSFRLRPR